MPFFSKKKGHGERRKPGFKYTAEGKRPLPEYLCPSPRAVAVEYIILSFPAGASLLLFLP